jgi:ABC-type multidrug transport system ATPase subunit
MRLRIIAPDGSASERTATTTVVRLGRDPSSEVAFDSEACPMVSAQHARIEQTASGCVLTHLSHSNKTLLNDRPVEGSVPLKVGDRIRLGLTGPMVEIVALTAPVRVLPATKTGPAPPSGATVLAGPQDLALLRGSLGAARMPVGRGGVIGRAAGQVEFPLEHPHVSRRHAGLTLRGGRLWLHDLGSANGTFVNGRRLTRQVALNPGDRIEIGPFSLEFDGESLVSRSRSNNIELVARRVRRVVKDRMTGKPLTLLQDVSLIVRPGEFVCLLGPSGSGKTTLLAMISGRNPPNRGSVRVNGQDLYENFASLKQDIAVVPQKDVLHDSLAVGSALRYTAEMRLPPDTARAEIAASVGDVLEVVGLSKRRGTLIRDLSGGQVKRASLANELIARPSLLFLDEVTSGLDEQTDREMMKLFRKVADGGKTVVCITHSLANVEATCHLVVILTEGGRLAFVGTPAEALQYFGIGRLGDVYEKLAERPAADWQAAFQASSFCTRYVRDRLQSQPLLDEDEEENDVRPELRTRVNPLRQAWILTRRYAAIMRGDPTALVAMFVQALMVALLLGTVFGRLETDTHKGHQQTVTLMFFLQVSCFWFGCNNASKEVVKERVIYTRERDFNLRIGSYLTSKVAVLVLIGIVQVSLVLWIARTWCQPLGSAGRQWCVLMALDVAGTALGLLISSYSPTEEVALALVPIVVIPQIILAGAIIELEGVAKWLANLLITARWGEQALEALVYDKVIANDPVLKPSHPQVFAEHGYAGSLSLVAAHFVLFTATSFAILWWRDRARKKG